VFTARYELNLLSVIQVNIHIYNRDIVFTARYELNLLHISKANVDVKMADAANSIPSRQCLMVLSGELRICQAASRSNGDTVPPFVW